MIGVKVLDIDVPETLKALAAVAAAIGIPSWGISHRVRRVRRAQRANLDRRIGSLIEAVSPSNGADKLADEMNARFDDVLREVRSSARTLEVVVGRQHEHGRAIAEVNETVKHANGRLRKVEQRLGRHLEQVDPLIRWSMEQSGIEVPGKEEPT